MVHNRHYAGGLCRVHDVQSFGSKPTVIVAELSTFGQNTGVIWEFAGGVLVVLFVIALVVMGIAFIKRLIE